MYLGKGKKMKKLITLILAAAMSLSMMACGGSAPKEEKKDDTSSKKITLTVTNGEGKPVDVEFPVAPKKVAVLNYQTLDFLDAMGLGHTVAGMVKGSAPEHLKKYDEDENIKDLGGMKDIDMEALAALKPDVIFSSDRTQKMYDTFSEIAPTMAAYISYKDGFMNSYSALAKNHAKIFDIGDKVDDKIAGYESRVNAIKSQFGGKTALLGIFADGLNTLGNTGRCSLVVNEMGFVNQAADKEVNHGNKSSYEVFLELNPEYMFIIDKDTAVGADAVEAKQQMENDIIKQTDAYKNNKIIYLEPADAWYTCDGGITAMDLMLTSFEKSLGMK